MIVESDYRGLQVLTDPAVRDEIAPPLRLLQRVIDRVPVDAFRGRGCVGCCFRLLLPFHHRRHCDDPGMLDRLLIGDLRR